MTSMGYQDRYEVIGHGEGGILRHEWRHDNYMSNDGKVHVEVHHEVGYRHVSGDFTSDIFWQGATSASVEGRTAPVPSNDNLLIYLCLHGAIHMWNRIGWIADVDRFVRGNPNMDWEGVMNRSEELGCFKIVSLGLLLAKDLLDSPLPKAVIPHTKTYKGTMRLKSAVIRNFFSDSHQYVEKIRRRLFYLRIIDRPRDRANYLGYLLESDQTNRPIAHLPFFRFFVHFSIRCAQLLIKSVVSIAKITK
jgi:hypothetical protein